MEIIVDKADKGGAILIYAASLAHQKITEKVEDKRLYDPSNKIYDKLIKLWIQGKSKKFVTENEAYKVVGLTKNNKKSTVSIYKPGDTYFNPSLKIHKMRVEDIKPGCNPPSRLITCAQDGVTSRTDVFIANKWLKPLQKDFCEDIVQDSIEILKWLENVDHTYEAEAKKKLIPFTFDFASLYDSLTPDLVKKSIRYAIQKHRPEWTDSFINWLLQLIELSMSAGYGKFENKWYRPKTGITTGGNMSVQLANIAVFYAIFESLFSKQDMMSHITSVKRFIDDGTGIFTGSEEEFHTWKSVFTTNLKKFDLTIKEEDWDVALRTGDMVHILDISYGFNDNGCLVTDLYRKDTDSRGYLHYSSCHPNHVFVGIVYSQALRIRRIVNDEVKFNKHLDDMKVDFLNSKYPEKMVNNIIGKARTFPRTLEKNTNTKEINSTVLISTYGRDQELVKIVKQTCKPFQKSVKCVAKTGPTLKAMLCNVKQISTGNRYGKSKPCGHVLCKCCPLMSGETEITSTKRKTFKTADGSCNTSNCIYGAVCKLCSKPYVGKSTQKENRRVNGHRDSLKHYIANPNVINTDSDLLEKDRYTLAIHLDVVHGIRTVTGLDDNYKFTILEKCSPRSLDVKEHLWIQKIASLVPFGLNINSPLGFPLIV